MKKAGLLTDRDRSSGGSEEPGSKYLTSYAVFLKHIITGDDGEPNVSGIFSSSCFQEWMATRKTKKVKFPAHSYLRVLYAHIRGADKRKPFPADIEEKLLVILRDLNNNPWTNVFKNQTANLGERGFPRPGYHEALKLLSEQGYKDKPSDSGRTEYRNTSETFSLTKRAKNSNFQVHSQHWASDELFLKTLRESPRGLVSPWEIITGVVQAQVPAIVRKNSLDYLKKREIQFWSPAMRFYLEAVVDPTDHRFAWEFLCPSVDERLFRNDRPVGSFVSTLGNEIFHQDANAKDLFRGSIIGKHVFELHSSFVSHCYSFIFNVPLLYGQGDLWRRSVLLRCDGSRMVCLMYFNTIDGAHSALIQDQTDLFPSIANNVTLI